MYYQGAFGGIFFETHPQLGGQVKVDEAKMRQALANRRLGLQRDVMIPGMHANSLAPQVADPSKHIEVQLDAICIYLACPKRIFMGSERGELSSNQDTRAWYGRVRKRLNRYVTPKILVPFINRLIQVGVLPMPAQYSAHWPDLASTTDLEKADIGLKRTQALVAYVSGSGNGAVGEQDYMVRFLGFTEEEAQQMIDSRMEALESEDYDNPLDMADDQAAEEEERIRQEEKEAMDEQFAASTELSKKELEIKAKQAKARPVGAK
jgi:hypothetical protein